MKCFASSVVVLAFCAASVIGRPFDRANDPLSWDPSFQLQLSRLPTSGESYDLPWSDTYWPSYQGGIANRWQDADSGYPGFNYTLYTLKQLKSGKVDLNILSPAEKFDIFNSRYDYPLTNSEWQRTSPSDATWEGICHGWAPAAIHYQQPNVTMMSNSDGLQIPFTSSDVKALLSYFLAQYASEQENTKFIAQRCNTDLDEYPRKAQSPECWDINPGTFHVMLTNMLGISRSAFVGDIDRSFAVWNQPIAKYRYTLGSSSKPTNKSAPGTVKEQSVRLTMYYTKETVPDTLSHEPLILQKRYEYSLHLDGNGTILGGSYDSDRADHVDFLWSADAPAFYGYFLPLQTIYESSTSRPQARVARRRITLANYRAAFVTNGRVALSSYDENTRRSWLVPASRYSTPLRLHFNSFNTRRHNDFVRVFEVSKSGEIGALLAVLHGSTAPQDITLRQDTSALITFSVDQKASRGTPLTSDMGFELSVF